MIKLESHAQGVVLPVRALAGARRSGIRGEQDGALKVSVTQVAEEGKANKALRALLSEQLDLRKSQIELIGGASSADKRFLIRQISEPDLLARIRQVLENG